MLQLRVPDFVGVGNFKPVRLLTCQGASYSRYHSLQVVTLEVLQTAGHMLSETRSTPPDSLSRPNDQLAMIDHKKAVSNVKNFRLEDILTGSMVKHKSANIARISSSVSFPFNKRDMSLAPPNAIAAANVPGSAVSCKFREAMRCRSKTIVPKIAMTRSNAHKTSM